MQMIEVMNQIIKQNFDLFHRVPSSKVPFLSDYQYNVCMFLINIYGEMFTETRKKSGNDTILNNLNHVNYKTVDMKFAITTNLLTRPYTSLYHALDVFNNIKDLEDYINDRQRYVLDPSIVNRSPPRIWTTTPSITPENRQTAGYNQSKTRKMLFYRMLKRKQIIKSTSQKPPCPSP